MQTTLVGSYPRVSDSLHGQRLRRAVSRWERKEISDGDLRAVQLDLIREVTAEQASLGVSVVTDGQVTWYDPVSHFASKMEGFRIGGLLRYFDTNTYYRQPKVRGKLRWTGPISVDDWLVASAVASVPVKGVVMGPFTLATHSAVSPSHVPDLTWELAVAIGHEIGALAHAGARQIQIDEPSLARESKLPKGYDEIVKELLSARGRAKTSLFVYFGGVGSFLPDLLDLPFDVLGLDLVQGASTLEALRKIETDKGIAFGLLDARNTKLEDPKAIAKSVLPFADRIPLDRSYLSPSNGLEYLPRSQAREKLKVLATAAKLVREATT